jgi:hypothetical protein
MPMPRSRTGDALRRDRRAGIEWDHIEPHARGGPTEMDNLRPLCGHHHDEKTAGRLVLPASPGRAPP